MCVVNICNDEPKLLGGFKGRFIFDLYILNAVIFTHFYLKLTEFLILATKDLAEILIKLLTNLFKNLT